MKTVFNNTSSVIVTMRLNDLVWYCPYVKKQELTQEEVDETDSRNETCRK